MKGFHKTAETQLITLADTGNAHAQYALGMGYDLQGKINQAIDWCLKAAEQQHPEAIAYFKETTFTGAQCLLIAQHYEKVEGVGKNASTALTFYLKACDLKNPEAAYYLGQQYQLEKDQSGLGRDHDKACEYFIKAVQYGHPDSLIPLPRLISEVSPAMQLKLGDMYLNLPVSDRVKAENCYQQALEGDNPEAQQRLNTLYSLLDASKVPSLRA
jgi:TPR repeat protein